MPLYVEEVAFFDVNNGLSHNKQIQNSCPGGYVRQYYC